jgi:hypothetical protein
LYLRLGLKLLAASGERWVFGISTDPLARDQVANLLGAQSLDLERYEPFGEESANVRPFGGLVVAVAKA